VENRAVASLIGLATGDAVGTTLEFKAPGTFEPIKDMVGGGPFNLEAGKWTDDTSMALCLAHSLLEKRTFDPADQMNRYCDWYHSGYMSSTGECFDIGSTVSTALNKYLVTKEPYSGSVDKYSSGNGSLMRLAPVVIFYNSHYESCIKYAGKSSRTTHGSDECIDSCRYFADLLFCSCRLKNKNEIISLVRYEPYTDKVKSIAGGEFLNKKISELAGTGYVIQSLEAALWCFFNTNSFEEAILSAANLGDDADTTAAICGQIAGAYYGSDGIPDSWKEKLYRYAEIEKLGSDLYSVNRS